MKNAFFAIGITILVVAGYALYLKAQIGSGMRLTLPRPDELASPSDSAPVRPPSAPAAQKKSSPQQTQTAVSATSTPAQENTAPAATTTETARPNGTPQ